MTRDVNVLLPVARTRCLAGIDRCRNEGLDIRVTSTLRTAEEQYALFAQGRKPYGTVCYARLVAKLPRIEPNENVTVTKVLTSIHQFALAWDFAIIVDGKVSSDHSLYLKAGVIFEGFGCVWGGRFGETVPGRGDGWDAGHCQYTAGLTLDALKAGKRPK